jgi:2-amino-4-hydroxy-6-hydroxymethyldihydropteridine diphosphokinase
VVLIGLGSNLDSPRYGSPPHILSAALTELETRGVGVARRSSWYRSEPVPPSDQPWFINAAAILETELGAADLLDLLQSVETQFGRVRSAPNTARTLDLDLLDHDGTVVATPALTLPHPRLHLRRFVLLPLAEIAPTWRHPRLGRSAAELLAQLATAERVERL